RCDLHGLRVHVSVDAAGPDRIHPAADHEAAGVDPVIPLRPVLQFVLLIVRPGALIMFSPAFGGVYAPAQIKIGLTVFIALALLPNTPGPEIGDALPRAVIIARD